MEARESGDGSRALTVREGEWVWEGVRNVLEVDLFRYVYLFIDKVMVMLVQWLTARIGRCGMAQQWASAISLNHKVFMVVQGVSALLFCCVFQELNACHPAGLSKEENDYLHEKWCNDLAAKFLCIFVLDRFGDFVADQVCLDNVMRALSKHIYQGSCSCS